MLSYDILLHPKRLGVCLGVRVGIAKRRYPHMKLNKKACDNAKPKEKPYKLADGGGLYLQVTPQGGLYWRLKYRFAGKEKLLALGTYPLISLADAREKRDTAKKQLVAGIDPSSAKQEEKRQNVLNAENTF